VNGMVASMTARDKNSAREGNRAEKKGTMRTRPGGHPMLFGFYGHVRRSWPDKDPSCRGSSFPALGRSFEVGARPGCGAQEDRAAVADSFGQPSSELRLLGRAVPQVIKDAVSASVLAARCWRSPTPPKGQAHRLSTASQPPEVARSPGGISSPFKGGRHFDDRFDLDAVAAW
jgi:hypothetical protein